MTNCRIEEPGEPTRRWVLLDALPPVGSELRLHDMAEGLLRYRIVGVIANAYANNTANTMFGSSEITLTVERIP